MENKKVKTSKEIIILKRHEGVKDKYELKLPDFLEYVSKGENLEHIVYNEMCEIYRSSWTKQYEIKDMKINQVTISGDTVTFHLSIDYEFEEDYIVVMKPKKKKEITK